MRKHGRKLKKQRRVIIGITFCMLFLLTVGYAAFQTHITITAEGNIKEKSRVIQKWTYNNQADFHADYYRENIVSVTFLDNASVPTNATESWDVSEDKKGGVIAYVIPNNEDSTKYDLYIGAQDGVIANSYSAYLFNGFTSVTKINFNDNFDTSNVTTMYSMFKKAAIKEIDLTSFNTGKVTDMNTMFGECANLEKITFGDFDTSNVIDMRGMFWLCTSLTELDLTSFNTLNTTSMRAMFMSCENLTKVNLCSFNTQNVTAMQDMFSGTTNLEIITVGEEWTTENANTNSMFSGSAISSVTTGQCG